MSMAANQTDEVLIGLKSIRDDLAASRLVPARVIEVRDILMQCLQIIGANEQPRLSPPPTAAPSQPAAFGFSVMFSQGPPVPFCFGLRFSASFKVEKAKYESIERMREQWELDLRSAFVDPTLHVTQLLAGSVIVCCISGLPPPIVMQRSADLVHKRSRLPQLEGLAPNWRPDCQQWYSPKQLQLLQPLFVPVPPPAAFLLGPPPAKSPASFGDPTDSQDSQLQQIPQTPTTPITRDDFIAWATEFGDNDTLERMRTDPTYCPWKQ